MSRAKAKSLEALHSKLAEVLADAMEPEVVTDENGNERVLRPSASVLNVARQFLKDNGIDAVADQGDTPLGRLAGQVSKYLDEDDVAESPLN